MSYVPVKLHRPIKIRLIRRSKPVISQTERLQRKITLIEQHVKLKATVEGKPKP